VSESLSTLLSEATELLPDVIALRRQIHRRPELGLELPETQRAVLGALQGLDLEVSTGGKTSAVVATLRGDRPGPTILLRADMDALPLQEDTGLDFVSEHAGRMHACGHDAHVSMLVGAARLLVARRAELAGSVKLVFQPGEEGYAGARILIEEGLLDDEPRVDAAFAIHVDSSIRAGAVAGRAGPFLAAGDVFSIDVSGGGGHASMPHLAADPIPVACEIVTALQSMVTRRINAFDPAVLTVTKIHAGSALNVIPRTAQVQGTFRTVSDTTRRVVRERLEQVVAGIAAAHGVEAQTHHIPGYPVTVNDDDFAEFVREVATSLVGGDQVIDMPAPVMGAEDFSYVLQRVPGAMVFLGARPAEGRREPLHSSRMRLEESALATGVALHAAMALRFLEGSSSGRTIVSERARGGSAAG
jgi:hippurate hydrolase